MRTARSWPAFALLVLFAACGDPVATESRVPALLDPARNVTLTSTVDGAVTDLIGKLFPKGLAAAANARWKTIRAHADAGRGGDANKAKSARQHLVLLTEWLEQKLPLAEPTGLGEESAGSAATRLVTYMSLYVFEGPNAPLPTFNPEAEATFEIVMPDEPDTVTTPSSLAGVGLEEGSVTEPTIITITQAVTQYPGNCNGPLDTRRCQYPLFYEFDKFPAGRFEKPVRVAVCHVDSSSTRRPLDAPGDDDVHDRLRLAKPLPANPADTTPGSTRISTGGENLEILPIAPGLGAAGVDCDDAPDYAARPGGMLGRLFAAVTRALTPAPLYAVDQGPEHFIIEFGDALLSEDGPISNARVSARTLASAGGATPINLVDPAGQPDLAVDTAAVVPPSALAGSAVEVYFTILNRSPLDGGMATASSDTGRVFVYLSADDTHDAGDVLLAHAAVPALAPDAAHPVSGWSVTIPAGTAPGDYHVLVVAQQPATEVTLANNAFAATLTVTTIPPPGADIVVFNDINVFDNTAAADPNNQQLYRNLVNFTGTGPRAAQSGVLWYLGNGALNAFVETSMSNVLAAAGYTLTAGVEDLTDLPAHYKVVFLPKPSQVFTTAQINGLKEFAGEGGRVVFVGENSFSYGAYFALENQFLQDMGAQMTNTGNAFDCAGPGGYPVLPATSLRPHAITLGLTGLTIACASSIAPGPNDYVFMYDATNTVPLAGVAKISLTPLLAEPAAARLRASAGAPPGPPPVADRRGGGPLDR